MTGLLLLPKTLADRQGVTGLNYCLGEDEFVQIKKIDDHYFNDPVFRKLIKAAYAYILDMQEQDKISPNHYRQLCEFYNDIKRKVEG